MDNNSIRQQSEFDMAFSYLNRINLLFYIADESAMELDVNKWYHALMTIHREVSTEMNEKELEFMRNKFKEINTLLQVHNDELKRRGSCSIKPELFDSLHDTELKIRKIMKDSGLQMKMKADARTALMDM